MSTFENNKIILVDVALQYSVASTMGPQHAHKTSFVIVPP